MHKLRRGHNTKQYSVLAITPILLAALNAIIGYIAVYFFKPLWEKIIRWWNNESNS